jgi:hypothetical protein
MGAGYGSMGLPAAEAPEAPHKQSESLVFKIVAAVAAAALGFFAWQTLTHHELRLPDTVAGMQKIESPALDSAIEELRAQAKAIGASGDAAIYGQNGVPVFIVLVIEGKSAEGQSADLIFQQFSTGFASSGSTSVDTAHLRRGTDGVATTTCARLRGSASGAMCMWVDPKQVGFVLYPGQSIDSTQTLTASIRSATES